MSRTGLTIANSKKTHLNLTPKQRTFAEVYVANYPNITKKEAAKQAGYSEPTCEKWGSILTNPDKSPHVVSYIEEMREKGIAHFKDFLRHLKRAEDKGQMAAAINSEFRLGQAAGFYIDRKEIKTQNLSALSKDDLIKSIKELHDELGETKVIEVPADAEDVEVQSGQDQEV